MKPPIETVSIIDAGAMGCVYASILYDINPGCVSFVGGGTRLGRLRQHTVMVNGKAYPIPVLGPSDDAPPADLVIVAVKHHHLDAAIRDMVRRVGDNTTILSVMNGIESEERLAAHEVPPDMIRTLWWKFMINVGINQVSAALEAPYGGFQQQGEARNLMESAMREVVALARASGVHLSDADIDDPSHPEPFGQDLDAPGRGRGQKNRGGDVRRQGDRDRGALRRADTREPVPIRGDQDHRSGWSLNRNVTPTGFLYIDRVGLK